MCNDNDNDNDNDNGAQDEQWQMVNDANENEGNCAVGLANELI